ncbi:MAG: PQQ-binding-like beta-propeller repeat protein, partial [Candidatus Bathyarchaeia archaeon]
MEKPNRRTLFTTILILTLSLATLTSIALAQQINYNPDMGTETQTAPSYMTEDNSVYNAATSYGNLLNEDYAWSNPHANTAERNSFNPGPAPDRPDVLWRTQNNPVPKVILKSTVLGAADGVVNPTTNSFSGAPMAMGGNLIAYGSIYVNPASNSTTRNAIISLNALTGAINWASIVNYGDQPRPGTPGASFGVASYIFKVDDNHFCSIGGGLNMWRTDGTWLWADTTVSPGAVYHSCMVRQEPTPILFGPQSISGAYTSSMRGWDLSNPETDMGAGNRLMWEYVIDEPGSTPLLAYGEGRIYGGSYSSTSVYAVDVETGEKVWETFVQSAMGYMTCYADGKLFVGCQSMHIYALDGATGEVVWHNNFGTANRAFNVWNINYAYGRIYIHDLGFGTTGAQKCLDADTGDILWASPSLFYIGYYRTVIADGKIYGRQSDYSTTTGREAIPINFCCWDAFTGEVLWNVYENIAGPIIAYGCLVYVEGAGYGDTGAQLVAMSTATGLDDWPMFRGSVETPGFTQDKGPTDISGGPKWTFTTGGGILSSAAVVDGKVYFNSNDRYVYCLNAYTGEFVWKFLTNEPLMTKFGSSPAVVAGKVYVGPDDGNFYVLNAETGAVVKQVSMGTYRSVQVSLGQHNIASSPIVYGSRVYVGSMHNGLVYCLDLNGNVQWSVDLDSGAPIPGTVAISGGYIYVMDWDGYINKIDMNGNVVLRFITDRSGDSFWSSFWGVRSYTPTVVGDRLWIGGTNNRIRCWDVNNGTEIYSGYQPNVAGETSHGSATYIPDWAIAAQNSTTGSTIGATTGKICTQAGPTIALARADTGENIWSNWGGWEVWSTPVFSGVGRSGVIYYGSDSAGLTVIDSATGVATSWWTAQGNIVSSPAVYDGKLYIGSYDNNFYCFEDRLVEQMASSISADRTSLNAGDTVTVTTQLTKTPEVNVYEEIGRSAPVPGLPDAEVLVTFTDPTGAETELTATTDKLGWATVSFTPDETGTWSVIA